MSSLELLAYKRIMELAGIRANDSEKDQDLEPEMRKAFQDMVGDISSDKEFWRGLRFNVAVNKLQRLARRLTTERRYTYGGSSEGLDYASFRDLWYGGILTEGTLSEPEHEWLKTAPLEYLTREHLCYPEGYIAEGWELSDMFEGESRRYYPLWEGPDGEESEWFPGTLFPAALYSDEPDDIYKKIELGDIQKCLTPWLLDMTPEDAMQWLEDPRTVQTLTVGQMRPDPFKNEKFMELLHERASDIDSKLTFLRRAFFSGRHGQRELDRWGFHSRPI